MRSSIENESEIFMIYLNNTSSCGRSLFFSLSYIFFLVILNFMVELLVGVYQIQRMRMEHWPLLLLKHIYGHIQRWHVIIPPLLVTVRLLLLKEHWFVYLVVRLILEVYRLKLIVLMDLFSIISVLDKARQK